MKTTLAKTILPAFITMAAVAWPVGWQQERPRPTPTPRAPESRPGSSQPQEPANNIKWESSLNTALARAKSQDKPVMIEFYKSWQQWARMLEDKTFGDPEVEELSKKFVNVRIDADKEEALAEKYGAKSFPTVVFLNDQGEAIHRLIGFVPPEPFEKEMQKIAAGREPEKEFQALVKSKPTSFRPLVMLGVGYLQRHEWDKAIEAYEQALKVSPGEETKETQEVVYALAYLYDVKKTPQKAERLLLNLLKTETAEKPRVHDMLGHMYLSMHQPDQAIYHFEKEKNLVEDENQQKSLEKMIEEIKRAEKLKNEKK